MLGVAAGAIFVILRVLDHPRMIAAAARNPRPNLDVTAQAAEARGPGGENVADAALSGSTEIGMGVRQRSRRYLGECWIRQSDNEQTRQPREHL